MEHEFHRWLKTQSIPIAAKKHIQLGIGDDGAILFGSQQSTVIATDTIAEGTHFDLAQHSLGLVGRKALAVNLSDLAAMAATPVAAVLTFLLPKKFAGFNEQDRNSVQSEREFGLEEAKELYSGIVELANQFDVAIVGGDTNTWDGPLVVGATVLGQRDENQSGWGIDGVQPGDAIIVSGSFGGSIHGRHLSFTPRIALATYLARHYNINAATDVSDSLSLDMSSMANASGVGIDFKLAAIPISNDVQESDSKLALQHALSDGEDFELILAVPQTQIKKLMADTNVPCQLTVVGTATEAHRELQTLDEHGNSVTFTPQGYVH